MKKIILSVCTLAVASLVFAAPPPVPPTPAAVDDLVYACPFTLREGYNHDWRKESLEVTSGYILVLKVEDRNLVLPRQVAMPVLYVGNQTAEPMNVGYESGHVVAIVPGEVDLTKAPIWYGTPDLPERVDQAIITAERTSADNAGIKPFSAEKVQAAERITVANKTELLRDHVADLILKYSPEDHLIAEGFRVPETK